MRMLYIMGSSLALTWGLNLVDSPAASAGSPPAAVQATGTPAGPQCRGPIRQPDRLGSRFAEPAATARDIC